MYNLPYDSEVNYGNYYYFNNYFSDEELATIEDIASKIDRVTFGNKSGTETSYRTSEQRWIANNSETEWLFSKLCGAALTANQAMYKFDLSTIREDIQHTTYHDYNKGHYTWHTDIAGDGILTQRKLSCVVMLSDPSDFEGGDLLVNPSGKPFKVSVLTKGTALFFPSWWLHKVEPVTKGTRKTLVLWLGGEHYR
tara:strand:+ start:639 stop:1223 length:585 start_codon:yes stop_codon:yes gene_type:complete